MSPYLVIPFVCLVVGTGVLAWTGLWRSWVSFRPLIGDTIVLGVPFSAGLGLLALGRAVDWPPLMALGILVMSLTLSLYFLQPPWITPPWLRGRDTPDEGRATPRRILRTRRFRRF